MKNRGFLMVLVFILLMVNMGFFYKYSHHQVKKGLVYKAPLVLHRTITTSHAFAELDVQDSTNLINWQTVFSLDGINSKTIPVSNTASFYRGEIVKCKVRLSWLPSKSVGVKGYKIYYGTNDEEFSSIAKAGKVSAVILTITNPPPVMYFAVSSMDGSGNFSIPSDSCKLDRTPFTLTVK